MVNSRPEADAPPPLWQLVPQQQYQRPTAPARDTFRLGYRYLLSRLKQWRHHSAAVEEDTEFQVMPLECLDQIAPPISWEDALAALDGVLEEWSGGEADESPVQVLVGPPGGGSYEIACQWAERKGWRKVPLPTYDQIFSGGDSWLDSSFTTQEAPQVLLGLEHCYLRHHNGLGLVRQLMESLRNTHTPCLVQCDSWGWAYLSQVLDLGASFPEPLVLQALDYRHLERWFQSVPPESCSQQVHEVGNERVVLSLGDSQQSWDKTDDEDLTVSSFLRYLAGHSRGIPGIAWNVWRHSLRIPTIDQKSSLEEAASLLADLDIRVRPWLDLELPRVPSGPTPCQQFLLHAILIHGGLKSSVLPSLIPFSSHDIRQSLQLLEYAGLLEERDNAWRVPYLGYPAVRQHLSNEGFLVDTF